MGGDNSDQSKGVAVNLNGTTVKHQVLSYCLLLRRGWNITTKHKRRLYLLLPETHQTMPSQIHCWAKKSGWGCELPLLFKGLLYPPWKTTETQFSQDTASCKAHSDVDPTHCVQLLYLKALWTTDKWSRFSETNCEIFQA